MASHSHNYHLSQSYLYIAVGVILITVFYVLFSTSQSLKLQNQLAMRESQMLQLKSRGFDPNPVTIRTISLVHQWSVSGISYSAQKAYLAPTIADFGDQKAKYEIGIKNKFFVLQADITNTTGQEIKDINLANYITLAGGGKIYKVISPQNWTLGAHQNITTYLIYIVPMSVAQFSLKTGISGSTKVTALDFSDANQMSPLEGVLMSTQGYLPQFPQ